MQLLRKLAGYGLLAFALFYAITDPTGAAQFVRTLISGIAAFASAVATGH